MKKLILIIAAILSSINLFSQTYSGGTGTAESPYQISTLEDLRYLSENGEADWDKHFIMMNDIDASETKNWNEGAGFLPIGRDENSMFVGLFDGAGYVIDSIYVNNKSIVGGFFGFIGSAKYYYSAINLGITNCNITSTPATTGGFVASNRGYIKSCFVTGNVDSDEESYAGGFVGWNDGRIEDCYAITSVKGSYVNGGFVGYSFRYSRILNCYTVATVEGNDRQGSFSGINFGKMENCYYDSSVSTHIAIYDDNAYPGQIILGKSTDELKTKETYVDWDFEYAWSIDSEINNGYPYCDYREQPPYPFSGGKGTIQKPYQISTLEDLRYLSEEGESDWYKHFILTNDIDASDTKNWNDGSGFTPIGKDQDSPFAGTFNGGGFVIDSLYMNRGRYYVGFFGYIGGSQYDITIGNLGLNNCRIYGNRLLGSIASVSNGRIRNCFSSGEIGDISDIPNAVGGLVYSNRGTISNSYSECKVSSKNSGGLVCVNEGNIDSCYATGVVSSNKYGAGGLVFFNRNEISNCYATGDVDFFDGDGSAVCAGGLAAADDGNIYNSYATGNVNSSVPGSYIGGLVGYYMESEGRVTINCFATGDVTASGKDASVGGLIGFLQDTPALTARNPYYPRYINNVINCYARGNVSVSGNNSDIGGFCGLNLNYCNIAMSYSTGKITINADDCKTDGFSSNYGGGSLGSFYYYVFIDKETSNYKYGSTTAAMKTKSTFTDEYWDFENVWNIDGVTNDGYPFLRPNAIVDLEIAAIGDDEINNTLQIYPNPATNQININYKGIIEKIEIYDITGQLIITANTLQIDVSNLTNGIYQVVLRSGNQIETSQLIILR